MAKDYRVHRYGFSGGLAGHLQWPLSNRFSLGGQIELLYTPRGAEVIFEGEYLGKTRQHYFDSTIAVRPEAQIGPASVYLLLGGSLNLLLSAHKEDASGMEEDITDLLSRYDVALLVSAGGALQLPHKKLGPFHLDTVFLEVRHDRGLIDTDPVNSGFKNRTTSLMFGLSLALGSKEKASPPARADPPRAAPVHPMGARQAIPPSSGPGIP